MKSVISFEEMAFPSEVGCKANGVSAVVEVTYSFCSSIMIIDFVLMFIHNSVNLKQSDVIYKFWPKVFNSSTTNEVSIAAVVA